jgi:hypothetical protein
MQQPKPPNLLGFTPFRGIMNGFIAGLIVGMLIGWFFHGLVGLVVRLGFVLLLLIPLAIVVWYFVLRRPPSSDTGSGGEGGMQVFTWSSGQGARRTTIDPRQPAPPEPQPRQRPDEGVIDIEFEELKREVDDEERRR